MMIPIFAPLILFAAGATVLGLIVFAIVSKKLLIIPVGFALLFLGLTAIGLVFVGFTAPRAVSVQMSPSTAVVEQMNQMGHTVMQGPPNFNAYVSGPNWSKILLLAVLIAFVVGLVARKGLSPAAGHGLRRAWPAVAVILFFALLFLFKVRSAYNVPLESATEVAPEVAMAMAAQHQAVAAIQRQVGDQVRMQQLAQSDIQKEIDQFDQPRIPLQPEVVPAQAPVKPAPAVKTNKAAKKPAPASTHKRKKPETISAAADTKQPQSNKQSEQADKTAAKKENPASSAKPAMVAEAEPEKPKPRPAWVDEAPRRVGGGVQREVIVTDLWSTEEECERKRDMLLMTKVYEHLQRIGLAPELDVDSAVLQRPDGSFFADPSVGFTRSPEYDRVRGYLSGLGITLDYARRETAKEEYLEKIDRFSVGPMLKLYTLVEFSPTVDRELRGRWENCQRTSRFATLGYWTGSIIGLLTLAFALLKLDTWTKGYYTKRLFIGVPVAIIAGLLLIMSKVIIDIVK
jgi:hypothetical protein